MVEWLNNCAGLFSLLAVLAAVIIPIVLYKRQKRDAFLAEKRREQREKEAARIRLEAMNDVSKFPMSHEDRQYYAEKSVLERLVGR